MKNQNYHSFNVIITQDEDGIFVANVPAMPGCHSQGETYEKAEKNIRQAIGLCLKVAEEDEEYRDSIDFGSAADNRMVSISNILPKEFFKYL